jgi:cation diffusion facilitator family transporter
MIQATRYLTIQCSCPVGSRQCLPTTYVALSAHTLTITMASPPTAVHYRIGALAGFIPVNEEVSAVSTRGQILPSLIQSRSSSTVFVLHSRRGSGRPRSNASISDDDEERAISEDSPRKRLGLTEIDSHRMSIGPEILLTPQMRSMRLIGKSNPRYHWHQYYKSDEELKKMKKPIRKYYERNNYLIAQYMYIDRLLDSSLPHDLIQEYNTPGYSNHTGPSPLSNIQTISEELSSTPPEACSPNSPNTRLKRTPKNIYRLPNEGTPLLDDGDREGSGDRIYPEIKYDEDEDIDSGSAIVTAAIYTSLVANMILLASKIAVIILTSSLSVLASLVDAALDFLSTAIVWTTTKLIARQDQYAYPIGRRRLEPIGVLVFSVIMITSFFQVALECFQRLIGPDHSIVELGIPAIIIMLSTVLIKGLCWFWYHLVKNSTVQALAQDAETDVVFNIFSIIFPLLGFYAQIWWLDALGGLLLSFYVMFNWSATTSQHVRNLCGAAATADQRNVLLYLTMRFAKTIKSIQSLQAYHAGDKLNVEVDIVLDENMSLRDSHDLSESLQYVLESVPMVDRAFVHSDYLSQNLPSHMNQQG